MIHSKCIRVCGVTTPVTTMNWFKSPCMCTTTGTTTTRQADDEGESQRRAAE